MTVSFMRIYKNINVHNDKTIELKRKQSWSKTSISLEKLKNQIMSNFI